MFRLLGRRQVRLGDYTQPVDATTFKWGQNDEYCEPYVADQLLQEAARRNKNSTGKMDKETGKTTQMTKNSVNSPESESDGYDHTSSWTNANNKNAVDVSPGPSNYEEPWDSRIKQRQLEQKLNRAKSEDLTKATNNQSDQRRYSNDRMAARRRPPPSDMYEDAWDTAEKQRQLQERLSAATRTGSSGNRSPTSPSAVEPLSTGLESRLEVARIHSNSITPVSPTRKSPAPRSPAADTYEEAWDLNSRAKALSYLRTNSVPDKEAPLPPQTPVSSGSPTHRPPSRANTSSSCTIGERINPIIPLQRQSWYHGRISRVQAENILCVCKEGSYLVRESESDRGQYSLTMKSAVMNIHLRVNKRPNGKYILGENSADFNSVPEMIDYYTQHPVPLKGAEHLTLLHPVEKN